MTTNSQKFWVDLLVDLCSFLATVSEGGSFSALGIDGEKTQKEMNPERFGASVLEHPGSSHSACIKSFNPSHKYSLLTIFVHASSILLQTEAVGWLCDHFHCCCFCYNLLMFFDVLY